MYFCGVKVFNTSARRREFKIFLHHDFRLYENKVGDTAYFDPATKSLIHYQKHRYFLMATDPPFTSFATGRKDFHGHEGTWRDAEDGELHGGATTEGSVDSTIGVTLQIDGGSSEEFYYWIAAGRSYDEVTRALDRTVLSRGPEAYLAYTENYWRAWVNKDDADYSPLPDRLIELIKRSLLIIHTQIDGDGAILAANDWEVTARATDHYSYLWTRDGAFVANALDLAGFAHLTRKFFLFCGEIVHPDGYFLQKYSADGSVASGWHPAWDKASGNAAAPYTGGRDGACALGTVGALRDAPGHRVRPSPLLTADRSLCGVHGRVHRRGAGASQAKLEPMGRPPRHSHLHMRDGRRRIAGGGELRAAFCRG
jgi:glucoamylase